MNATEKVDPFLIVAVCMKTKANVGSTAQSLSLWVIKCSSGDQQLLIKEDGHLNQTKHPGTSALSARAAPFFDKQMICLGASARMQIGIALVFSITCCDLHSLFV